MALLPLLRLFDQQPNHESFMHHFTINFDKKEKYENSHY
jgi:hypothetical protein